jgi:hypothetical protein
MEPFQACDTFAEMRRARVRPWLRWMALGILVAICGPRLSSRWSPPPVATREHSVSQPPRAPEGRLATQAETPEAIKVVNGDLDVRTPGCGAFERQLTLPERAVLARDEREEVREVLEDLRITLVNRFPIDLSTLDEEAMVLGPLFTLRSECGASSEDNRRGARATCRHNSTEQNVAYVQQRNDEALADLRSLLGEERANEIWPALSWCSVRLDR